MCIRDRPTSMFFSHIPHWIVGVITVTSIFSPLNIELIPKGVIEDGVIGVGNPELAICFTEFPICSLFIVGFIEN